MAENTLIVKAVQTWPTADNYSIITDPDTGMPSLQKRVRRAQAYQNGTMTALKLKQCLKDPAKVKDLLCAAAYAEELRATLNHAMYQADYLNAPKFFNPKNQTELTNGAFAPLVALYHYAFGDGSSLSADLVKLSTDYADRC